MPENNIVIREMKIWEIPAAKEIEDECFTVPWSLNSFISAKFNYFSKIFAVLEDEKVCGYLAISTIIDEAHIVNFAVSKKYQRKGYGKMLIEYIIEYSRNHSLGRVLLEVRESNKTAINLYIKNGFVYDGKRKGYYTNPSEDAILMSRDVSS